MRTRKTNLPPEEINHIAKRRRSCIITGTFMSRIRVAVPSSGTGLRWLLVLVPALPIFFWPLPGLDPVQRRLLAIFVGTILALVAQPVPMGVSVIVAMTT